MKYLLLFSMGMITFFLDAQLPYTENIYDYTIETDVEYGYDTNYAGLTDTLLLDIYKPIGDNNCKRPCLILVHGGAWVQGSKNDPSIVNIAKSFAEKGWVVAAINYRLGTHKAPEYTMYLGCALLDISVPCGYISDSSEVFRANYRGQQDAKGAIRFMKNRAFIDSLDIQNVFIAGESAGGFISLAATFMDAESEKPEFCNVMADAPNPDADLVTCLPLGYSLERPDLGDINGTLNLGENDATVQGVGNFFGGILNLDIIEDETDWPVMYMFHQGNDVIVNYNYGRLLGRMDWECYSPASLCQNYARYPRAYGSKGIETYLETLPEGPERLTEIIENYEYMNDCLDAPPGHAIDNWVLRSNNMSELFAEKIQENGNVPTDGPCDLSLTENQIDLTVYPNPSKGLVTLFTNRTDLVSVHIYSSGGQLVQNLTIEKSHQVKLDAGIYILKISASTGNSYLYKKLIII